MSHLPAQASTAAESAVHWLAWPQFVTAGAALAIVGVLVFQLSERRDDPELVAPVEHSPGFPVNDVVAITQIELPKITPEQVGALTMQIEQPLQEELENVLNDTRTAIQFVASNFLPEE